MKLNEVELNKFVANIERILLHEIKANGTGYQAVLTTKELLSDKVDTYLEKTLFDCLEYLQEHDLITYYNSFKLTKDNKSYITTFQEDSIILGIIDNVKKEMGKNPKDSIYFFTSSEIKEYYEKIDEKVKERFGYDHCQEAIRILFSESAIQRDFLKRIENIINNK